MADDPGEDASPDPSQREESATTSASGSDSSGADDESSTDTETGDTAGASDDEGGISDQQRTDEAPDESQEQETEQPEPSESPRTAAVESSAAEGPDTDNSEATGLDTDDFEPGVPDATSSTSDIPDDVRSYDKFSKIEGGTYDRANEFLRERTYITAREWAIARLCADFRTETGVEMTKIGENLPRLVPFMTDTYSPQAVNQARASFEEKVRKAGATFLYGAMSDFFSAEELDDVMYETTEVAKFLLEVEGVDLTVEEELEAEDRISEVMREVREHSVAIRHDEVECPDCGHRFQAGED